MVAERPLPESPDSPEANAPAARDGAAKLSLSHAAGLALLGSVVTVVVGIARSKVTAVVLGPEGIGESAEINQLFTLVSVPIGFISGIAFITVMARELAAENAPRVQRVYDGGFSAVLLVSCAGAVIAAALSRSLLPPTWGPSARPLVLLAGAALIASAPFTVLSQTLVAHGKLKAMTALSIVLALMNLVITCVAVVFWGLLGAFAAPVVASIVGFPFALHYARPVLPRLRLLPRMRFDLSFFKVAVGVGATSMVAGWTLQGALTAIRWSLDARGGLAWNGQFQAANVIAGTYFNVVGAGLGNAVFPRYAAAQTTEDLNREVAEAYDLVLRILPPMVYLAIACRAFGIHVLYDHRFDGAISILGVQMVSDILKGACWVLGGVLLARARLVPFLIFETTGSFAIAATACLLIPRLGLVGAGYAFLAGSACGVLLSTWLIAKFLGLELQLARLAQILLYAAGAGLVLFATGRWPWTGWLVAVGVAVWAWRAGIAAQALRRLSRSMASLRQGRFAARQP